MGTIVNGANGGFSGKAGSVIGASWKSINYIRGLAKKSNKPYTEAQLIVQARFKTLMRFLLPVNNFLKIGFGQKKADRLTPLNYAFQLNQELAIQGVYPDLSLDYSKIRIADGIYGGGGTVEAGFDADAITVVWSTGNNDVYETKGDDLFYVICYHPAKDEFMTSPTLPKRQDGVVTFGVPEHLLGDAVHIWYFMSDRTKTKISRSSYLGEIMLA
ncbi:hypothetical protein K2F45_01245 [Sphingobacterium siyangense]|uniref:DUF6266 family protein n=1 Tax=Sphingobacterium siyangense TaxID=459529 RepID=UPI00200C41C6|nr:DUF6266 family protein [Sphingobacterium siyangense]UQA75667.1 hypothetical protein K2F45_01245 [Sphingobacterium siyangense]